MRRPKERWVVEFATELKLRLRPHMGMKLATAVALVEYSRQQDKSPVQAAEEWADKNPVETPAKLPKR